MKDVEPIDLANRRGANADRERAGTNLCGEPLALIGRELLRIIDAANDALIRRHDDGARDNGTRERAPSDFIDAGDQWTDGPAKVPLDGAPAIAPRRWCKRAIARVRLVGARHDRPGYSAVELPVSGTATRTFFSLMRVALPVR